MGGTAHLCDAEYLTQGATCIIEVDSVNSPEGTWHGEVVEVEEAGDFLRVQAVIKGPLEVQGPYLKALTAESAVCPTVNYRVYPDTRTMRQLFRQILFERGELERAQREADSWRTTHLETMAHLTKE
jgi:hypothetical protein